MTADLAARFFFGIFLLCALLSVQGAALAALPLMVWAAFEVLSPLLLLPGYYRESQEAAKNIEKITEGSPQSSPSLCLPQNSHLEAENVFFRYLPSGPWVLEGVSLDLPPGKKMAIVGPSGAGKSTFINLLMRFWDY